MHVFDRIDPTTIDRRDWQLWLLAVAVILVLSGGVALLMYPAVFSEPLALSGSTFHTVFFAFCILCFLLVGYLMDRHILIRRLRRQLIEEHQRNVKLLEQASAELLQSLPGLDHFRDQLAMEIRRASTLQQPLSLLIVGLKASHELEMAGGTSTAFGDAAKTVIRRLRREDSIYFFRHGIFGIVLPAVSTSQADRVMSRLQEGLTDASGASSRFSFEIHPINFPEHAGTTHELEKLAILSFPEDWPGLEGVREESAAAQVPAPAQRGQPSGG
jgi:GGDEF domain-containing protein